MNACVIGGGSWGSAVALHLGRNNIKTRIWIREQEVLQQVERHRENKTFLPGAVFPETVFFTNDIIQAVAGATFVFIAVPSKYCREIYDRLAGVLNSDQIIISLTKGIEKDSLKRMSKLMTEVFSPHFTPTITTLSGPSFALEVAKSYPTAVVVASQNEAAAKAVQRLLSNSYFRVYTSDDIIGVELAGALKNVMAISAGILDGLNFGSNSIAALITRGLAEMARLGIELGAKKETFPGLAGIGDLVLTCTGSLSRNRYVGYELGRGKSLEEIVKSMKMVAEGITTTMSARQMAQQYKIEMPICEQVYNILYENKEPRTALQELMMRRLKDE